MVTQSLLKADVLSQRFLAVAALALRKKKWGKKEIPSCNGKNFIFFLKKGSTVENCPTLMRIPNVSWRPTKSEEWGKQWEVADSRLYHPALVFDQINWYFWEELHPAVFTTSQLWTGPSSPSFLSCALCWKDGDLPQHLCIFQKLWAFHALSLPLPLRNHFRLIQPFQKHGRISALGQPTHNFFFLELENNTQTCTRHSTALTTPHKSQELLC